uniref:Uncharacterized protein n=1 Tax=Arundo donax TaxID=35708 RepID=A0A0A9H269_ARUDO
MALPSPINSIKIRRRRQEAHDAHPCRQHTFDPHLIEQLDGLVNPPIVYVRHEHRVPAHHRPLRHCVEHSHRVLHLAALPIEVHQAAHHVDAFRDPRLPRVPVHRPACPGQPEPRARLEHSGHDEVVRGDARLEHVGEPGERPGVQPGAAP